MSFTTDQQKVIDARDVSLIVSAAAGSGKTTVMVERIIGLITDPDVPVDIDTLLIVTFTNAAAAQMKEKIRSALENRLEEDPGDENLKRQSALIHNAHITTIDSFCQFVIRNSMADIDIDPGFRIAEEGENKLLESDVLDELIEELYGEEDPDFAILAERYSSGTSDDTLRDAIMKIYRQSDSDPWPRDWIGERATDYDLTDPDKLPDNITGFLRDEAVKVFSGAADLLERAVLKAESGMLHSEYIGRLYSERDQIEEILGRLQMDKHMSYDGMRTLCSGMTFETMTRKKAEFEDADIRKQAGELRSAAKEKIRSLTEDLLASDEKTSANHIAHCAPCVKTLCNVVLRYIDKLDSAKAERKILSFSDCEHLALNILVKKTDDGKEEYTDTAALYRDYFSYVFIDEYQDSNKIQELILSSVSKECEGVYNRFMVGDVKQSIYGFRQADPEIFIRQYSEYGNDDPHRRRIDLNMNFRSRRQVLDSCNALFEKIMTAESGGIAYDDAASLKYGSDYPEIDPDIYRTEILFGDATDVEGDDALAAEARIIAERIEQLVDDNFPVRVNPDSKETRPVEYGDIVILYRSNAQAAVAYKQALEEKSIPAMLSGSTGYFATYEISNLMNLLRIISNPLQDIPFYGVMTSVIGEFAPEEAGLISHAYAKTLSAGERLREGYMYDACRHAASGSGEDITADLREKTARFVSMLDGYRKLSEYLSVRELLSVILDDTGYRARMLAMRGGERRLANVDMLLRKAADYAQTSYFGLYDFIRYIDTLEKTGSGDDEAQTPSDEGNMVRIMTTHKSKGLEFPVVIVARMGNLFNTQDSKGDVLCDHRNGLGIIDIDEKRRLKYDNLIHRHVRDRIRHNNLAEEMRILYVAMTRAKEKLIMTCVLKSKSDEHDNETLVIKRPDSNTRYADWQLQCLCDEAGEEALTVTTSGNVSAGMYTELIKADLSVQAAEEASAALGAGAEILFSRLKESVSAASGQDIPGDIETLYSYEYPHDDLRGLYAKTSVSVLKHAAMPDDFDAAHEIIDPVSLEKEESSEAPVPHFISGVKGAPGATVRGSAFHRILELMNINGLHNIEESDISGALMREISSFAEEGRLSRDEREILEKPENFKKILAFLSDPVSERMAAAQKAGRLYREAPFMMGIPADLADPKFPSDETVLIQGIVDVYWIEDNGAVILDYKTDRVHEPERLIELYKTQLDYYAKALEQMHIPVISKLIYSFELGCVIEVD